MRQLIQHTGYFITIYSDYLEITDDFCAAQILTLLETYTAGRIELLNQLDFNPELWIYLSIKTLNDELLGLFSKRQIEKALKTLYESGFIEKKPNTSQYKLNIKAVQETLDKKRNQKGGAV